MIAASGWVPWATLGLVCARVRAAPRAQSSSDILRDPRLGESVYDGLGSPHTPPPSRS